MLHLFGIRPNCSLVVIVGIAALAVGVTRHRVALIGLGAVLVASGAVAAVAAWQRPTRSRKPDDLASRR
jgi:hypothetical protein